jgi:hypothetical protein
MPLLLVAGYALAVLSAPAVSLAGLAGLFFGHVVRNSIILLVILACVLSVFLMSDLRRKGKPRTAARIMFMTRRSWRKDRMFSLWMPVIHLALLFASFSSFKQLVLPGAGTGLDPLFAEADRALFMGVDPWKVTHWLLPSPAATKVLDIAYLFWFFPMMLFVLLSGLMKQAMRARYLLAFTLMWIVPGTLVAYLLPGSGPCYFDLFHASGEFLPLKQRLEMQSASLVASGLGELLALGGQNMLFEAHQAQQVLFVGGISAMPSLHVALAVLFACFGFACRRALGWALTLFAVIIWIGSVHLGWHYAIDGLAGALLAMIIWAISGAYTVQSFGRGQANPVIYRPVPQPAGIH